MTSKFSSYDAIPQDDGMCDSLPSTPPVLDKRSVVYSLVSQQHIRALLVSNLFHSTLGVGFDVVFVLYSYTRIDLGGMGRTPIEIGYALAATGLGYSILLLFIFPFLARHFNIRKMYMSSLACFVLGFSLMPLGNLTARARWAVDDGRDEKIRGAMIWIVITTMITPIRLGNLCYILNMVLTKAALPKNSPQLGALFGLNETCAALARAFGPALVSVAFALSTKHIEILRGYSVWVGLVMLGVCGVYVASKVQNVEAVKED